jgi:hypothetical protein
MATPTEKRRFMRFYMRCMQRTLYIHGTHKTYLSKSPAHSCRVRTLHAFFLDAKYIYTTRNPLSVFPSTLSLFSFSCGLFSDLLDPYPFGDHILEITKAFYIQMLTFLENNTEVCMIVRYEDQVQNLAQTIRKIYADLGLALSPAYEQVLQMEVRKTQRYHSHHQYNLTEMGYSVEQIITEYQDVFERFKFDKLEKG